MILAKSPSVPSASEPAAGTNPARQEEKRKGVVVIAVLVVVIMLSLAGYQYSELMLAEYRVSENAHRAVQARCVADSGIYHAMAMLSNASNLQDGLGGNPFNYAGFNGVSVGGDTVKGMFSLVAPADPSDPSQGVVYGVMDEGGKINLNALMKIDADSAATGNTSPGDVAHGILMALPNMTEEIANAIIDWMDADSDPRSGGAENDYYMSLTPAYRCKNGPIDSIDELLLVKGITRDLLYGTDWNRNGMQDASENTSAGFDRGWSAFLTVHSREQNCDTTGKPYVYLMNQDMTQLYNDLMTGLGDSDDGADLAKFIIMYRQNGGKKGSTLSSVAAALGMSSGSSANTQGTIGDLASYELDPTAKSGNKGTFQAIFDLASIASVTISQTDPTTKKQTSTTYNNPLSDPMKVRDLLPKLFAVATMTDTTKYSEIPPRININTAPAAVLSALGTVGNLGDVDIEKVLSTRPSLVSGELLSDPIFQTPTWLLTEAQLDPTVLSALEPLITTRTQVFRVQSIGYFAGKGPAVRVEAVIDTNCGRPRIVAYRNMTDLGKGWDSDVNP
jgi:type II secretory pathway component PulK